MQELQKRKERELQLQTNQTDALDKGSLSLQTDDINKNTLSSVDGESQLMHNSQS